MSSLLDKFQNRALVPKLALEHAPFFGQEKWREIMLLRYYFQIWTPLAFHINSIVLKISVIGNMYEELNFFQFHKKCGIRQKKYQKKCTSKSNFENEIRK